MANDCVVVFVVDRRVGTFESDEIVDVIFGPSDLYDSMRYLPRYKGRLWWSAIDRMVGSPIDDWWPRKISAVKRAHRD